MSCIISVQKNGLKVNAYAGVEMVMLAFNLDQTLTTNLAGFAIKCYPPKGDAFYLQNRLTFKDKYNFTGYTADTLPEERKWFDSINSPFQYFRWLHVPAEILSGTYTYEVIPMYFGTGGVNTTLSNGPSAQVSFDLLNNHPKDFDFSFTKGYLSSQAYADKFNNKDIRPAGSKTVTYDIKPYMAQYEWLGGKAHRMLFDFLKECASDHAQVKALIYDCDHPEFVQYLQSFGDKLSAIMDDASLHTDTALDKPEDQVFALLQKSSGNQVVRGHFKRFQHNKVLIKMDAGGKPEKVFAGSANFSIRGLYVQANNCMVINNADVAADYNTYFDTVYQQMKAGKNGMAVQNEPITQQWLAFKDVDMPAFSLSFSPHKTADISLGLLKQELDKVNSSVFFAIMELDGGGDPLTFLKTLPPDKSNVFHYGITQHLPKNSTTDDGSSYTITQQGGEGDTIPFAYLKKNVPEPFRSEISGGIGQVIHDKFVVIDFNTKNPVVFTGSSNLSSGGEVANGDNLLAIYDPDFAVAYAVEAVRLFDHFNFRNVMNKATTQSVLALNDTDAWTKRYYDPADVKFKDRQLFGG